MSKNNQLLISVLFIGAISFTSLGCASRYDEGSTGGTDLTECILSPDSTGHEDLPEPRMETLIGDFPVETDRTVRFAELYCNWDSSLTVSQRAELSRLQHVKVQLSLGFSIANEEERIESLIARILREREYGNCPCIAQIDHFLQRVHAAIDPAKQGDFQSRVLRFHRNCDNGIYNHLGSILPQILPHRALVLSCCRTIFEMQEQ